MKYTLVEGRPEADEGRLGKEIACYDFLDSLGMEYERIDHEEANTMEACQEIDEVLGATICKNLFLTNRQHTAYYLLLMPDNKVFKTKEITKQIGSARLSFASGEEMERLIGCTPGSSSILGLMFDKENEVQLIVDQDNDDRTADQGCSCADRGCAAPVHADYVREECSGRAECEAEHQDREQAARVEQRDEHCK